MTARPLSDAEARRVTTCPECEHAWAHHGLNAGRCWGCNMFLTEPCTRPDESLTQVAALVAEREAAALHAVADEWQRKAWVDVLPKAGTGLMAVPQAVTDWLREKAREATPGPPASSPRPATPPGPRSCMPECPGMPGSPRCPTCLCDCFLNTHPDDPLGLHPEAFVIGADDPYSEEKK